MRQHVTYPQDECLQPITFDEFQKRWRQMRDRHANPALRYFNQQNDAFKFCVLTLANRDHPKTFKANDVGEPFESFDECRRELIIEAMNKLARWGHTLPQQFSTADRVLPD